MKEKPKKISQQISLLWYFRIYALDPTLSSIILFVVNLRKLDRTTAELLNVNLCGMCCLSMKAIVILDMLSTMILPGAMLYALSFIYTVFIAGENITMLTLILYGVILGAQVLIFLVRIDHFFWFLIYLIFGIPVFFFILPLYSFWNMDDLSWGTRRTQEMRSAPKK